MVSIQHRDYAWHLREWEPGRNTRFAPGLIRFLDASGHDDDPLWHVRQWEPL